MLNIAVLASGSGSNFQAIQDSIIQGRLHAEINVVLCNQPKAYVIERAKKEKIPCRILDPKLSQSREDFDLALVHEIQKAGADTVVLAGYMRLLSSVVIQSFPGRILNIHPSLLPAFPGIQSVKDAQSWGAKFTGCTVHFVDEIVDHGPIIIQAAIPVFSNETLDILHKRIHEQEHRIYPQALQWLTDNRLKISQDRVVSLQTDNTIQLASVSSGVLINPPLEKGF